MTIVILVIIVIVISSNKSNYSKNSSYQNYRNFGNYSNNNRGLKVTFRGVGLQASSDYALRTKPSDVLKWDLRFHGRSLILKGRIF